MKRLFGPVLEEDGILFRLWAPSVSGAAIVLDGHGSFPMQPVEGGFFEYSFRGGRPGQFYRFEANGIGFPDPASRLQEQDPDSWSIAAGDLPPADDRSRRRKWTEAVICEVHVGTATPEGTFEGLRQRLRYFADAGYTALELMPIADFCGRWNWGYDGVLPFAVDRSYGTREDLRALVDDAHRLGLAIVLDVVYNHFGPCGNYLERYAEPFFNPAFRTPWGAAVNFAEPNVRAFFLENAAMWLQEFGIDGLRFDAVHAFKGEGAGQFLHDLERTTREIDPECFLILENDANEARWLAPEGGFTAQWNDDFHHVLHVLATGERDGYYGDYAEDAHRRAARVLTEGFAYQGEESPLRGCRRGEISRSLHPVRFVSFAQNHDQIGNRARGDRLSESLDADRLTLLRFALLLSPQVPLLFMGEECGVRSPFPFFCDFSGDLAEAVRNGRREEFQDFGSFSQSLPDPVAEQTFLSAKLPWHEFETPDASSQRSHFRALGRVRRTEITPLLESDFRAAEQRICGTLVACSWFFEHGSYSLVLNLGDAPATLPVPDTEPRLTAGNVAFKRESLIFAPWSGAYFRDALRQ